jgi:hypothetical protein
MLLHFSAQLKDYTHVPKPHLAVIDAAIKALDVAALTDAVNDPAVVENDLWGHLLYEAATDSLPLVQVMLDKLPRERKAYSALHAAAINGNLAMLELLLPYCNPKAHQSGALRLAATYGHLAIVERLLPLSNPKAQNSDALRSAAARGHLTVVKALRPVSDVAAQDHQALRLAAANGHEELTAYLCTQDLDATVEQLITKRKWKNLDALAGHVNVSTLRTWLDQAPTPSLPKALARVTAHDRQAEAVACTPTEPRRRTRT